MFVWNDFDNDDRVNKKAYSLSKHFDVYVFSVCKKPKAYSQKRYNDNLFVQFIWFDSFWKWLLNRLIHNKRFWKNSLLTIDVPVKSGKIDIVDCNDADTLWAGVLLKEQRDCKLIYDSHELWSAVSRIETDFLYTLYATFGNPLIYMREIRLVKYTDKILCVSKSIEKKLLKYKKPVSVIYNYASYNPISNNQKENSAIFFGTKLRGGVIGLIKSFLGYNIPVASIGTKITLDGVSNKGYLSKSEYCVLLPIYKYGICYTAITCDNMRFSMPNKLFQYIQAEIPMIVNRGMVDATRFVAKNEIGSICTDNYNDAIMDLVENYEKYLKNIKRIKRRCSWEYQEPKLVNIYKLFEDMS